MDMSLQQTCQQDRWCKIPLGLWKSLKWSSHALLVDRCYFMTERSKMREVLACRGRPCFLKVLIQKPNICDISEEVCGKVGTSPPWQAGPVLCFSIVRRMTENAVQGSTRNYTFGSDGHWLLQERFSPLQRAGICFLWWENDPQWCFIQSRLCEPFCSWLSL